MGDIFGEMESQGQRRSYRLHLPPDFPAAQPLPLVVALHGASVNADAMVALSGLNAKADSVPFVVVYPNGTGDPADASRYIVEGKPAPKAGPQFAWNAGTVAGWSHRAGVDDVGFVVKLIQQLSADYPIDRQRIYAVGMSNGGMLAYRLACERSEWFAAVGCVTGVLLNDDHPPARPIPIIHFHGTADEFVPYEGGQGPKTTSPVPLPGVPATIAAWCRFNHCSSPLPPVLLADGQADQMPVWREAYRNPAQPEPTAPVVVLIKIVNGGHTWPGRRTSWTILGPAVLTVSANDLLWEFFASYRNPLAPT